MLCKGPTDKMETALLLAAFIQGLVIASARLPTFTTRPSDTQTVEGRTALLECVIEDTSRRHYAQWIKGGNSGKAISSNYTINTARLVNELDIMEPLRYQIVGDFSLGEFNLQIVNTVNAQDDDTYRCIIADMYGPVLFSNEIHLSVASPSAEQYPLCLPSTIQSRYIEDDVLSTECIFRHGDPSVHLKWTYGGATFLGDRKYSTLPDIRRDWGLTADDDGAVFTCEAISSTFSEPQKCQIGPITVMYAPKVYVEPASITLATGESVMFTCSAASNPTPSAYVWEINGNVVIQASNKYSFSENGKYFTIDHVSSDENGISVTCVAANTIGLGTSSVPAILLVENEDDTKDETQTDILTTDSSHITGSTGNDRTLTIIIVASATGIALIFLVVVLIFFRKTVLNCCRTDSKGICWKATKVEKKTPANNEMRFSNLAELSSMISSSLKQKQLDDECTTDCQKTDDGSPVPSPYTTDVTIV